MLKEEKYSFLIKQRSKTLGFDFCGIAKAEYLSEEAPLLEKWLNNNMHANMGYMERYFDKRLDPRLLVQGAKSVICLMLNYYPKKDLSKNESYKIAKYSYGKDYHVVIKKKLKNLLNYIQKEIGEVHGRVFVDSAPVMERAWAKKSGLGWIGKHSLLLTKKAGSFFFLAEVILDLDLAVDHPTTDHCGTCTRCMEACPTDAIVAPEVIDSKRCISYLTIELKGEMPANKEIQTENWIFGCDICQDVCPWNRFSKPHQTEELAAVPALETMDKKEWEEITHEVFKKRFGSTPLTRAKLEGIKRNIRMANTP